MSHKPRRKRWPFILALGALALVARLTLGIFVQQPIGAIPEGATVVYWRAGLSLPFVASADGMALEATGGVSLLSRMAALGAVGDLLADRRIVTLPYSRWLYLRSTGGREFDR